VEVNEWLRGIAVRVWVRRGRGKDRKWTEPPTPDVINLLSLYGWNIVLSNNSPDYTAND
jgi:hypothetical protein